MAAVVTAVATANSLVVVSCTDRTLTLWDLSSSHFDGSSARGDGGAAAGNRTRAASHCAPSCPMHA